MVYLLKIVIFHGYVSHHQMVIGHTIKPCGFYGQFRRTSTGETLRGVYNQAKPQTKG